MQIKNISLLCLAAMAAKLISCNGATIDKDVNGPTGIGSFDLMTIGWEPQAHPSGENLTLTGTVEELLKELRTINPDYDQDFGITALTSTEAIDAAIESAVTQADDTFKDAPVNCAGYDDIDRKRHAQGARYLLQVHSRPWLRQLGPCQLQLELCHLLDSKAKTPNSFKEISDGAYYVIDKCYRGVGTLVNCRAFHKDDWTVVARWDCC
ncbi:hypothetical protein CMEL01_14809 [Colletotrichum melonis]|uniref:Secreted protein n=1 Tax=Colletotrichum melonis TaxID=1209925 RepID=A0AAI9XVJ1_9PEZI|nr:hypothetical protein CMEL01_14809 [Colletotrichum melonis]